MNNRPTPAVAVRNLCKTYAGASRPVLSDVGFTVEERELVCIVGHSGTGKSTLLRAIAGLTSATGEMSVNGRRVDGPPADLAVVFQDYGRSLLPWMRVRENVELPLRRTTGKAERRDNVPNPPSNRSDSKVAATCIPGKCPAECSSERPSPGRSRSSLAFY